MQVMTDEDPYRPAFTASNSQWSPVPHVYPHSHHGTPVQEYTGFQFGASSAESNSFQSAMHHRPPQPHLQPLVMPQWPSMLNSQSNANFSHVYSQQPAPIPMSAITTPASATSTRSSSTPRKTLTDADRKRMCQYAEEHPQSKQTEIGAIFGVERSTVSKVLRQKEKYLFQDDGSRSPIKRAKGRSPDIERALANWAKNQEKKGVPLTDDLIRDKARAFAATTTTPENHVAMSASWIEKFKLRNNLMGARSRKSSLAPDEAAEISSAVVQSTSPISPDDDSPTRLQNAQSSESLKDTSPEGTIAFSAKQPFHSQSTTSLSSAFTDTAPSSFSPGPLSPTSPFFTPDSGVAPGPFNTPAVTRGLNITGVNPTPANSINAQRPRSQTFPLLDQYLLGTSAEHAPKYTTAPILDSPMEEQGNPVANMTDVLPDELPESRPQTITPADTMRPPPLPNNLMRDRTRSDTPAMSTTSSQALTSPEEARNALQVVLSFFEQQPQGFLDLQESVTLGKLMEKLKPFG